MHIHITCTSHHVTSHQMTSRHVTSRHVTSYHITSPHTRGIPVNNHMNWFILNMTYKIHQIFAVNCSYYCYYYCYHRVVALWEGHHCYCHSLLYHLFFYSYSFGLHSLPFDDCGCLALVLVLSLALSLCPRWIEWLGWLLWCGDSTCLVITTMTTTIMMTMARWWQWQWRCDEMHQILSNQDVLQDQCVTKWVIWRDRKTVSDKIQILSIVVWREKGREVIR